MSLISLRDELLQAKKTEIAKCVAARKRKLSQLLTVAIAFPEAPLGPPSPTVECAFFDQNDIEKGRLFSESTLPSQFQDALRRAASLSWKSAYRPNATTLSHHVITTPTTDEAPTIAASTNPKEAHPADQVPSSLSDDVTPSQMSTGSQTMLQKPSRSRKASPLVLQTPLTPLPLDTAEDLTEDSNDMPKLSHISAAAEALTLESPPGSPGVNPHAVVPESLDDRDDDPTSTALRTTPGPAEVVSDAVVFSIGEAGTEQRPIFDQEEAGSVRQGPKDQEATTLQPLGPSADDSSSSSTMEPHSASTPLAHAPSPATTTEEVPTPTTSQRPVHQSSITSFSGDLAMSGEGLGFGDSQRSHDRPEMDVHTPDAQLRLEHQQAQAALMFNQAKSVVVPTNRTLPGLPHHILHQEEPEKAPAPAGTYHSAEPASRLSDDIGGASIGTEDIDQISQTDISLTEPAKAALSGETMSLQGGKDPTPPAQPAVRQETEQPRKSQHPANYLPHARNSSVSRPSSSASMLTGLQRSRRQSRNARDQSSAMARSETRDIQSKDGLSVGQSDWLKEYQDLRGQQDKDYFQTLYSFEAFQRPRATSLRELLPNRTKAISTSDQLAAFSEEQDYRILKRVKELQEAKLWSLLQIERCSEPTLPVIYLDTLLGDVRWLAVDFREERKWKVAAAKCIAAACAIWVASTPEERASMQVKTKSPGQQPHKDGHAYLQQLNNDTRQAAPDTPVPDLVESAENESASDEHIQSPKASLDASNLSFSNLLGMLHTENHWFTMEADANDRKMLSRLPSYDPNKKDFADESMSEAVVPVSKYAAGKIVALPNRRTCKRRRFDYEEDAKEEERLAKRSRNGDKSPVLADSEYGRPALPPEQTNVALFDPANLHQRERLWAAHAFRPPPAQEYGMPSQKFYESRWPSQWLQEKDDKLRGLVREYSYNWPLISSCMAPRTLFPSAAERRTPWECFERWVRLEGLPPDMAKHTFFKTWQARVEAARRANLARLQAAEQQQQAGSSQTQTQLTARLRPDGSTESFKVAKRRNTRHISFLNMFKRNAQREETIKYKKEETRKAVQARKAQEVSQPRSNMYSPRDWSKMKHERELKVMEKQAAWREQVMAQQRQAAMMQRAAQQGGQPSALPNGSGQHQRSGSNIIPNGQNPLPNGHVQPGPQSQPRMHNMAPPMQPNYANGGLAMTASAANGIPQAQMQPNMRGAQGFPSQMTPEKIRMIQARQSQAHRIYQAQQQFAGQQNPGQSAPASMQSANHHGAMYSPAQLAAMQAAANANGMSTPPVSDVGRASTLSNSPHNGQIYPSQHSHPQPLSSGHVPVISHISHQIQAQQPHLSPDQVKQLSSEQLKQKLTEQQRQNALNAAAGSFAVNNSHYQQNGVDQGRHDPAQQQREAQYKQQMQQQMLRQQQQQQQRLQAQANNNPYDGLRPQSRSATPQYPQHQRTNSGSSMHAHAGAPQQHRPGSGPPDHSQSPRPLAQTTVQT